MERTQVTHRVRGRCRQGIIERADHLGQSLSLAHLYQGFGLKGGFALRGWRKVEKRHLRVFLALRVYDLGQSVDAGVRHPDHSDRGLRFLFKSSDCSAEPGQGVKNGALACTGEPD